MTKNIIAIPLILALLVTGCIVTGNILVVIELEDRTLTTSQSSDTFFVSEDDHPDWQDHADDIKHIVDVGFAVTLHNREPIANATGEFYISKIGTLNAEDLTPNSTDAYIVLSGLEVAAGEERKITWQESYNFLSNFQTLKQYGMDGEFYLYVKGVGTPLTLDVKNPAVIVTLNAKP